MAELPPGWTLKALRTIAEVGAGDPAPQGAVYFRDGAYPFVRTQDVGRAERSRAFRDPKDRLNDVAVREKKLRLWPAGTTLVPKSGASTALNNRVRLAEAAYVASHLATAVPRDGTSDAFLYHALCRLDARTLMGNSGYPSLNLEDLGSAPILVPSLPEQRAIAAVLDAIDDAIERTEAVIAATERLREALLHELLTRGVPGWHSEWKQVPGLGTVPACWDVVRLGDILKTATYGTNVALSDAGAVPVLRMNNLQNGELDLSEVRRADLAESEARDLRLASGDILFNRTNSLGLVGKIAIVRDLPDPMSFASYLVRLRVKLDRVDPFWLAALLASDEYQSRIRRFATPAVSQANINPTSLKSLTIPLPTVLEQREMCRLLDALRIRVGAERAEHGILLGVKSALSDALLTGRVRVQARGNPSIRRVNGHGCGHRD